MKKAYNKRYKVPSKWGLKLFSLADVVGGNSQNKILSKFPNSMFCKSANI